MVAEDNGTYPDMTVGKAKSLVKEEIPLNITNLNGGLIILNEDISDLLLYGNCLIEFVATDTDEEKCVCRPHAVTLDQMSRGSRITGFLKFKLPGATGNLYTTGMFEFTDSNKEFKVKMDEDISAPGGRTYKVARIICTE